MSQGIIEKIVIYRDHGTGRRNTGYSSFMLIDEIGSIPKMLCNRIPTNLKKYFLAFFILQHVLEIGCFKGIR